MSTTQWVLLITAISVVCLIGAVILTRYLVLRGMRTPWVLRLLNRLGERLVGVIRRPLTVVVLDEVSGVIQTGTYSQNISDAILENRRNLKELVLEKVSEDPSARVVKRMPGYDKIVDDITDSVLRILVSALNDPRTDELIADLLRNNLEQIKHAVHKHANETVPDHRPPDPY